LRPAAVSFVDVLTPLFFYLLIAAYIAFLLASAWQFSRKPESSRIIRGVNLTLVPLGILVALVGVLAATFNSMTHLATQQGTPSTPWALVMVALGLGGSSLLLAAEGLILRSRHPAGTGRRDLGLRTLSLFATTLPLLLLGALLVAFAVKALSG
jgi:hypothetical protein